MSVELVLTYGIFIKLCYFLYILFFDLYLGTRYFLKYSSMKAIANYSKPHKQSISDYPRSMVYLFYINQRIQ